MENPEIDRIAKEAIRELPMIFARDAEAILIAAFVKAMRSVRYEIEKEAIASGERQVLRRWALEQAIAARAAGYDCSPLTGPDDVAKAASVILAFANGEQPAEP